jgi:hypothetical protein
MVRSLVFATTMLASGGLMAADYTQPPGAPEIAVPNHGVVVSVFAAQTAIGHGIGIFEKRSTGWYLCGQCLIAPGFPTLDSDVAAAGGPGPYVASKLADVNAVLSIRFPPLTQAPSGTTLDRVNGSLSAYTLRLVNGSPALGLK